MGETPTYCQIHDFAQALGVSRTGTLKILTRFGITPTAHTSTGSALYLPEQVDDVARRYQEDKQEREQKKWRKGKEAAA